MKKLFTMLVASVCCTMAYAQTISVNDVSVAKGGTGQVEVSIANPTNYTAFQFDLKLPAGVSVKKDGAALKGTYEGDTRKLEWKLFNESTNTYRFLSYDMGNAALKADGNVVAAISIEVAETAETGDMTGGEMLVVTSDGTGTATETATGKITVSEAVKVTIGKNGVTTLVSDKDLDFSNSAVMAYIAYGYNNLTDNILLTRVKDVPANTPILLMGEPSGDNPYVIPVTTSSIYYPVNFLKGNATEDVTVDNSGKYFNMRLKDGEFQQLTAETFQAGKCYLQVPATSTVVSTPGEAYKFTMGKNGTKSYTGKYDLDFTNVEDLAAYVVTGYNSSNTVMLSRAKVASANTPLVLLGTANKEYEVPSSEQKASYVNMLRGDANNAVTIQKIQDGMLNLILKSGEFVGLSVESAELSAGTAYLPVPSSIIKASTRFDSDEFKVTMEESEVITMKANIGGTTGISRVASEVGNDVWYNLNGQRIDTPTKKGLYIKNGKKVIVK